MPSLASRLRREPLLLFALIGALLFGADRLRHPPPTQPGAIVLTRDFVDGVRRDLTHRGGRPPSQDELRAALERFADEEVLYREAASLGLDRGDPIVRRRMIQKMEVLLGGEAIEPTSAELSAWRDAHRDRYASPSTVDITQVYLAATRGDSLAQDCAAARARLEAGALPSTVGDPFVDGTTLRARSRERLATQLGDAFARAVFAAPTGEWVGPLASPYGCHHARVESRAPPRDEALAALRERLRADLLDDRRASSRRQALQLLRARHVIRVEGAP